MYTLKHISACFVSPLMKKHFPMRVACSQETAIITERLNDVDHSHI
jgi:hypothetical protein